MWIILDHKKVESEYLYIIVDKVLVMCMHLLLGITQLTFQELVAHVILRQLNV